VIPPVSPASFTAFQNELGWRWWANLSAESLSHLTARYQARVQEAWGFTPKLAAPAPDAANAPKPDRRFASPHWNTPYFAALKAQYEAWSDFLVNAVSEAKLPERERKRAEFFVKQHLDAIAPTNSLLGNPNAIAEAIATQGESVKQGMALWQRDAEAQRISMTDFEAFEVGKNVATTPGAVVFRNELIELIQYTPTTKKVFTRPLLIVPPCINKYYILDLTPENSFVKYALDAGHTVFIVSWRNVPEALGTLTWEDYLQQGALTAIDTVKAVTGEKTINALGFCVGGTILSCALAILAARGDKSVASTTLLTTLLDFRDPGEIQAYISEAFLNLRESELLAGGRLKGKELADAFASLRANELIWFFVINNYLLGKKPRPFDLLYWNSDSTNLPGPFYVYYLREFYLRNQLRERNTLTMLGEKIDLEKVAMPKFVVSTREDHIVPWKSGFASAQLFSGETHFVLGGSGHIAGIVNPPAKKQRQYWAAPLKAKQNHDTWLETAPQVEGSWWPAWTQWLAQHGGKMIAPRALGSKKFPVLDAAPGKYVFDKA
jgi:polyhydroxyalkanoate synthase subunit PhaC